MRLLLRAFLMAAFGMVLAVAGAGSALANTCSPANAPGTAPADYKAYCWLEFSGYSDATAQAGTGQLFNFSLPDGSSMSMQVKTEKVGTFTGNALTLVSVPSWSGSAFGNTAFTGIPGQTIFYNNVNGTTVKVTLSGVAVTPPAGASSSSYSIILGDGESSNGGESIVFTTNGGNWTQVAKIANGASTTYPTIAGVGSQTATITGADGTVGSYVLASFNNPTTLTATIKGSGLQGFIVGVRYASVSVVSQVVGQRYDPADQFSYTIKTAGGTTLSSGATTGTAVNGFTPASLPTIAASYPFVIGQAMGAGSVGTLSNYTTSLTCTNSNTTAPATPTPMPTNSTANPYTIASMQYGDSVACVFTNTPIFAAISGTVYNDANHNSTQDNGEAGPGVAAATYVKLATSTGGVCQSPATAFATINNGTGAYSLPNVPPGSYCLVLSTNTTLSDITPTFPAGRLGTQNPTGLIQLAVTNTPATPSQNFGLYFGAKLSGTVLGDTGVGTGGVANNGVKDGTEPGIASMAVNATSGTTTIASATTAGDGTYTLWVPGATSGAVTVTPAAGTGYLATGGSAGSSGGTYTRPNLVLTPTAGQTYVTANFGLVPVNTLAPNNAESGMPGTTLLYAHSFVAGSAGQVTFTTANVATPTNTSWSEVIYRDANCNAQLESTETAITASLTVTAGQQVCLIVKEFIPETAGMGAINTVTLSAAFSYTGAAPALAATRTVTDITTVGQTGALNLSKLVSNITQASAAATTVNAAPGNTLQYSLTALNNGPQALSTLVISDATPAFTTYLSAACPGTLPTGLTACAVSANPGVGNAGNLQWTFTGSLSPTAQVVVTYQVKVNQ